MKNLMNVLEAKEIEITYNHIGNPAWTSETFTKNETGFVRSSEEASNFNFDADNKKFTNHDMVKYVNKNTNEDTEIVFN